VKKVENNRIKKVVLQHIIYNQGNQARFLTITSPLEVF
jgi:hypothetical protein